MGQPSSNPLDYGFGVMATIVIMGLRLFPEISRGPQ
jgi:hypothetical protein